MPKDEKWNYTDGDATRKSVYLPNKIWEQVDTFKDKKGIRSTNKAFHDMINEHTTECENNHSVNDSLLPCICPRFNFENIPQPPAITGHSGFCTVPAGMSYATINTGNRENPQPTQEPFLYLHNIGNTSAKEVRLGIYDNHGKKLDEINRFALAVNESHRTRVNLNYTKAGRIKGTYQDVTGKTHPLDTDFHYPM